jgi:hypothetical protein
MKRITCLLLVLGLTVVLGCAEEKPEAAAKKIFEAQVGVAGHEGLDLDTSGLVYNITEQGDNSATVEVSGNMAVKASIPLVKEKGQWVLAMPSEQTTEKEAETH